MQLTNLHNKTFDVVEIASNQTSIKFPGKDYEVIANCSLEVFCNAWRDWLQGEFVQNAFYFLSADDREFIKTTLTPAEWDDLFGMDDLD